MVPELVEIERVLWGARVLAGSRSLPGEVRSRSLLEVGRSQVRLEVGRFGLADA
jgi:hypothetical protein